MTPGAPPTPTVARRPVFTIAVASALLVVAWLVAFVTPTELDRSAPFVTTMSIGEPATGRNISATIDSVRLARAVHTDRWSADAGTLWVVVDLAAEAVRDDVQAVFGGTTLRIGDRTYEASERPASLARGGLSAGIPANGVLAFEIPASAADAGIAQLDLSIEEDVRLDSVLRLDIDLTALDVEDDVELAPTEWGR